MTQGTPKTQTKHGCSALFTFAGSSYLDSKIYFSQLYKNSHARTAQFALKSHQSHPRLNHRPVKGLK
jgi:hypothetical protein